MKKKIVCPNCKNDNEFTADRDYCKCEKCGKVVEVYFYE